MPPVNNTPPPPDYGYDDYGYGEDYGYGGGTENIDYEPDSYYPQGPSQSQYRGPQGQGGGTPIDAASLRAELDALFRQIHGDTSMLAADRRRILLKINELRPFLQGSGPVSQDVMDKYYDLQALTVPAGSTEGTEGEEGEADSPKGQVTKLQTKIQELKTRIVSSDLSSEEKSQLSADLDRAKASLEINPTEEQLSQAQETVSGVETKFTKIIAQPKAARDLSTKLNKSVEDIVSAAEEAGVNLNSLPNPPNEKVMKMLSALGVPSKEKVQEFNDVKKQREKEMKALKEKLKSQDDHWHSETEDPPSKDDFKTSFKYYNREDDKYKQLEGIEKEMQSQIIDTLNAMGYQATATRVSDQISINGTTFDFFKEETGLLTLSTTMTDLSKIQSNEDFYPAPKNTESDSEDDIWGMSELPSGYPKIQYTVD